MSTPDAPHGSFAPRTPIEIDPDAPRLTAERRTPILIEPPDIRKYLFDGMTLAVGGFINSSHPMTLVREVIRSGVKDIRVVGAAMSGLEIDMLIAAGAVREVVSSFVSGEVYAPIAPMFRWAVEENEIRVWDCDEMMYYSALRAGAMRVPFMPVRSGLGTSMPELNTDLKQFTSPVGDGEVLAVPAIRPDLALLHGDQSDAYGNVQITGTGFGDRAMFRAANVTICQVERIVTSEHIRLNPARTVFNRIEALVRAPYGCHPFGSPGNYREDGDYLRSYVEVVRKARAANDRAAVTAWIDENIRESGDHIEYLERVGVRTLVDLLESEEVAP